MFNFLAKSASTLGIRRTPLTEVKDRRLTLTPILPSKLAAWRNFYKKPKTLLEYFFQNQQTDVS